MTDKLFDDIDTADMVLLSIFCSVILSLTDSISFYKLYENKFYSLLVFYLIGMFLKKLA